MLYVIDTAIVDLYIMYRGHMIWLRNLVETMPHLKWNVALPRALGKKGHMFYSKGKSNGRNICIESWKVALFYAMDTKIKEKKGCVWYVKLR
jgi:hypothetical protein